MIDTLNNKVFVFQNIHKSSQTIKNLLEQFADSADFIFIQEALFSHVRNTTSTTSKLGDVIEGPPIQAAWQEVHHFGKFPKTQVCIYINQWLLSLYWLSADPNASHNLNVLVLTIADRHTRHTATVVCLYNLPKTSNLAIHALLHLLPNMDDLLLLQGDFNLHSPDWDLQVLQTPRIATDLMAALTLSELTLVNDDSLPTWHHKHNKPAVLDLLFVADPLLRRCSCNFQNDKLGRGATDHSLLRLWIGCRSKTPGQQYIPQDSDEEEAFIAGVKQSVTQAVHGAHIQDIFDQLYDSITKAWNSNMKTPEDSANLMHWWSPLCDFTKQTYENTRLPRDKKIFDDVVRRTCTDFFNQKIHNMTVSKKLWEGVRWMGPQRPPSFTTICDTDGAVITDPQALFQHMHSHFNSTVASGSIDWDVLCNLPTTEERSALPISVAEIMECLSATSNLSAPGEDHLTWRHLKLIFLDDLDMLNHLVSIFNCILDEGTWPSHLKVANSCIIPKPKKDRYNVPKAFRPIALLNTIGKLMTKVLAKQLQFDGIAHGLFHLGQFGGVTKHATTDVGVILMDIISQNRDRGFHTSVLAIDIAQFFPSMDHEVIVYLLGKLSFHRKICNVVANFLRDRQTSYTWDGISSEAHFNCSNGVPQGDPLSPVLSALYLSLIIKHVLPWDKNIAPTCFSLSMMARSSALLRHSMTTSPSLPSYTPSSFVSSNRQGSQLNTPSRNSNTSSLMIRRPTSRSLRQSISLTSFSHGRVPPTPSNLSKSGGILVSFSIHI